MWISWMMWKEMHVKTGLIKEYDLRLLNNCGHFWGMKWHRPTLSLKWCSAASMFNGSSKFNKSYGRWDVISEEEEEKRKKRIIMIRAPTVGMLWVRITGSGRRHLSGRTQLASGVNFNEKLLSSLPGLAAKSAKSHFVSLFVFHKHLKAPPAPPSPFPPPPP